MATDEPSFDRLAAWDNLLSAWRRARKGKRARPAAAAFDMNAGEELLWLRQELREGSYRPRPYHSFAIHDPKRRWISAAPFRDRVVHHALCAVLEPAFERRFIGDSYANRRGRGTHAALHECRRLASKHRYFLPCDVRQFFASVDHEVLLGLLRKVVADEAVMDLCALILASGEGVLRDEYSMRFFPGDDLLAVGRPRGLPIGNLTSQFWANVYLDPLDQFIKRTLRCQGYLRYVDDFVLFADSKVQLWSWRTEIMRFLENLRLTLHEGACHPRPVAEGIPFLGWIVSPCRLRLKRRKGIAYRRRLRALVQGYQRGRVDWEQLWASIRGWANHASFGGTAGLRRAVLCKQQIQTNKEEVKSG